MGRFRPVPTLVDAESQNFLKRRVHVSNVTCILCDVISMWRTIYVTYIQWNVHSMSHTFNVTCIQCDVHWMWRTLNLTYIQFNAHSMWRTWNLTYIQCDVHSMWRTSNVTWILCDEHFMWRTFKVTYIKGELHPMRRVFHCDIHIQFGVYSLWRVFAIRHETVLHEPVWHKTARH